MGKTSEEGPKEAIWCDHVAVVGLWIEKKPALKVLATDQAVFLVVEDGKVKLVCPACLLRASRGFC